MDHTKSEIKRANTLEKRRDLHRKISTATKLMLFLTLVPLASFAGQQCEIHASTREVTILRVPLGAATTLELPYDFKFAVPGNPIEYEVQPVQADSKMIVVVAKTTMSRTTSLTIGLKEGKPISFWLVPVDRKSGCVYAKVRRVL